MQRIIRASSQSTKTRQRSWLGLEDVVVRGSDRLGPGHEQAKVVDLDVGEEDRQGCGASCMAKTH